MSHMPERGREKTANVTYARERERKKTANVTYARERERNLSFINDYIIYVNFSN